MPQAPLISYRKWKPNTGSDPAAWLVDPGTVRGPDNFSAGDLRWARPFLVNGDQMFVFPTGVEGFRRSGTATLGLHKYIGDNADDGVVIHLEEARIELSGIFPGITAQVNMVNCINILRAPSKDPGLTLYAPGVFNKEAYVLPENWDFSHDPDDRTHSINYTISFVRIGEGRKIDVIHGTPPPPNPQAKTKPKGKPTRIFTAKDGARTLRAIAAKVYKDAEKWKNLVKLNQGLLTKWNKTHPDIPTHQLPTFRWPIGTKFRY